MTRLKFSDKTKRQKSSWEKTATRRPLIKHQSDVKWYSYGFDEKADSPNSAQEIHDFKVKADALYKRDVENFNQSEQSKRGSEAAWISTVITKGTAADRKTALELVVRISPVHCISHVSTLVNIIEKKGTREAYSVLGLLKDLFLNELLPHNRKLIPFGSRPLKNLRELSAGSQENMERRLILWKFESDLKDLYCRFINGIEKLTTETVESVGAQACRTALDLLAECPEQEQRLLTFLVNKLGYPNRALSTKVSTYLVDLTYRQPKMRGVIIDEVERLIFRKQIRLCAGEKELAVKLLKIYFSFFHILVVNNKLEEKTISVLLSGVNRAFPFAKGCTNEFNVELDLLYKVLHQTNFGTAVQILKLLSQLSSGNETDRFYNALYKKMLTKCPGVTTQNQLLGLLFRVLKRDLNTSRVIAFVKRMLQLSLTSSAGYACATLLMVSRLILENPDILKLSKAVQKTTDGSVTSKQPNVKAEEDEEEEHFVDVDDTFEGEDEVENESKTGVKKPSVGSWLHTKNIVIRSEKTSYDRSARNPSFAKAELSVFSELLFLRDHYHPSVSLFASNILEGIPINYDGEPLTDFSAARFLDRFVYKNPKGTKSGEDNNVKKNFRKAYNPKGVKTLSVTSKEYMAKTKNEIPVDEQYIHHFVTTSLKKETVDENDDTESTSDVESVNSDEFDMLLNRIGPNTMEDVFDVDFGKEFSSEKRGGSRKRNLSGKFINEKGRSENDDRDGYSEEDDDEEMSGGFSDEDDFSDADNSLSPEGSDDESFGYSDNEFSEELGYEEDAAISADKLAERMEGEDERRNLKAKERAKKRQKRKTR